MRIWWKSPRRIAFEVRDFDEESRARDFAWQCLLEGALVRVEVRPPDRTDASASKRAGSVPMKKKPLPRSASVSVCAVCGEKMVGAGSNHARCVEEIAVGNKAIIERAFQLQRAIASKNDALAMALQRAFVPLLEYRQPLGSVPVSALQATAGVGPKVADLVHRLAAGESVDAIAATVPKIARRPQGLPRSSIGVDLGNWDGSWDNSVRAVEDQ